MQRIPIRSTLALLIHMRPFIFLLLLLLNIPASLLGQEKDSIHFRSVTFEQALEMARAEKKPVFLHGYASWCHYCSEMAEQVYTDKEVADFFNARFVCIKMDMEKEGREMNKKLRIKNFPTHVFFDYKNAQMMHRAAGKKSKEEFLQTGRDAIDSTKQLRSYEQLYYSKKATAKEAATYMKMLDKAGLDNQPVINSYLLDLSTDALLKQDNWRIMYDLFREVELPAFQKVMENRGAYAEKYSADSIDNKIISMYNAALMMRVQKLDSLGYRNMTDKLRTSGLDLSEKIIAYADLNSFKMKSDWKSYQTAAVPFIDKYCANDYRRLNDVAYNFYERVSDKELLAKAETWAQRAVTLQDNIKNNHTLAGLYFKLGKKEQAKITCEHTIELARKAGVDYKQSTLLLEKIDAMKTE